MFIARFKYALYSGLKFVNVLFYLSSVRGTGYLLSGLTVLCRSSSEEYIVLLNCEYTLLMLL